MPRFVPPQTPLHYWLYKSSFLSNNLSGGAWTSYNCTFLFSYILTSMLHHCFGGASWLLSPSQSAPFNDGFGLVHVLVSSLTPPPQLRVHSLGSAQGVNAPLIPGGKTRDASGHVDCVIVTVVLVSVTVEIIVVGIIVDSSDSSW